MKREEESKAHADEAAAHDERSSAAPPPNAGVDAPNASDASDAADGSESPTRAAPDAASVNAEPAVDEARANPDDASGHCVEALEVRDNGAAAPDPASCKAPGELDAKPSVRPSRRAALRRLGIAFLLFMFAAAAVVFWGWRRLETGAVAWTDEAAERGSIEVMVEDGDRLPRIVEKLQEAGMTVEPLELRLAARIHHRGAGRIQTGLYRFLPGVSAVGVIDILSGPPLIDQQVVIPDGAPIWTVREIFSRGVNLRQDSAGMTEEELRRALGLEAYPSLEGFFAPETYRYGSGTSDLAVMRKAVARQKKLLEEAWASRSEEIAVKTPYEALILASIIEKESGVKSDRHLVSSVFHNRMKVGMPLQTDPTVIYGLGPTWNGRITRADLRRPGPYNTYLIPGLPPTPISNPTPASIEAAVHPTESRFLYFVSRGDGSSEFTTNLRDHNKAVEHYILKKRTDPIALPSAATPAARRAEERALAAPLRAR